MKSFLFFLCLLLFILPAHAQIHQSINGLELTLVSPLHSKDQFKYSTHQEKDYTVLKELVLAGTPNIAFGSQYVWKISSKAVDEQIVLEKKGNFVEILRRISPQDDGITSHADNIFSHPERSEGSLIAIIQPIIFWDRTGKQGTGQLSVDGNLLTVSVTAKSSQYPLRIDPTLKYGQWLGGNGGGPGQVTAILYNAGNTNIDFGGIINSEGNMNLTVTMQGTYNGGTEGFVLEVADGGTPSLKWGQWLGGAGDDAVNVIAINGTSIYAAGYSTQSTNWDTTTFFGSQNGGSDAFVVNIADGGTPCLQWMQWLGGPGTDLVNDMTTNGATVYVGGYTTQSTSWETTNFFGVVRGTDGFVANITDGGSPSLKWVQWLGGNSSTVVNAMSANGTSVYAGGYVTTSTNWNTVTFQGIFNATGSAADGFVVNMTDGGSPSLKWGQWIGGIAATQVNVIAVNGATIYAGGFTNQSTNWSTTNFFGTYVSAGIPGTSLTDGFVVNISEGGSPCLVWGQWLGGGAGVSVVNSLAVNGATVYAAGYSSYSTAWQTTAYFNGAFAYSHGFVVNITDGGSPTLMWLQWLGGGTGTQQVTALAANGAKIWAAGYSALSTSWTPVTFQGTPANTAGFVVEMNDGGSPTLKWGQWVGATQAQTFVQDLVVNGTSIYAGGYTTMSTNWTTVAFHGTYGGGYEGFVVNMADGGTPSLKWGQWLGGYAYDIVNAVVVNGPSIYAGGVSQSVIGGWETTTYFGAKAGLGVSQGFVVKITEGGTPSLNWAQWTNSANSQVLALAINGPSIYLGGVDVGASTAGWGTITFHDINNSGGSYGGYVAAISDSGSPSFKWGQWIGGFGANTTVSSLAVNNTSIYAGGYTQSSTNWSTVAFQGVYAATSGYQTYQGFVVNIADGGTPCLAWGQWLGGQANTIVYALAVNGASIYAGGYTTMSTGWETVAFSGKMQNTQQGFVVNIAEGATPSLAWGQWLGGTGATTVWALAVNGATIYAGGTATNSSGWNAVTFLGNNRAFFSTTGNFILSMAEGGTPGLVWGQWLGGNGTNNLRTLALYVNGSTTEIFAGGYMYQTTNLETLTFQGTMASNWNGFVVREDDYVVSSATNNNNGMFFDTGF